MTSELVPLPDLQPLLAGTTVDDADARAVFRALGEVPLRAASGDVGASRRDRLAVTERALSLQAQLREHVTVSRSAAFARVQHVLAQERSNCTAAELLARAPMLLCSACGMDRALLSRVDGSTWVPSRVHVVRGEPLAAPASLRVALRGGLREAEVVRRRQPMLVRDGREPDRTDTRFVAWFDPTAYVVAPLVLSDRVVGLLHADRQSALTSIDRDAVAAFVFELARTYEHLVLVERFAQQRARVRASLAAVDDSPLPVSEDSDGVVVRLARRGPTVVVAQEIPVEQPAQRRLDGLTEREVDVLRLMAEGATNLQVAVRLVVSESTVKSHVKQILRKLAAANRAEAVFLYLSQAAG